MSCKRAAGVSGTYPPKVAARAALGEITNSTPTAPDHSATNGAVAGKALLLLGEEENARLAAEMALREISGQLHAMKAAHRAELDAVRKQGAEQRRRELDHLQ